MKCKHAVACKTSNTKNNKCKCNWAHHSNIVTELWKGEKLQIILTTVHSVY